MDYNLFMSLIVKKEVPFPLKALYMKKNLPGMIQTGKFYKPMVSTIIPLQKRRNEFEQKSPSLFCICNQNVDYPLVFLTDVLGSEDMRLRARQRRHTQSIMTKWETADPVFIRKILDGVTCFSMESVRESIYRTWEECSNFKLTAVISLFHILKSKKVLDMCAGWGDRLVGALLSPTVTDYFGADPNTDLQPVYKNMIHQLSGSSYNYQVSGQPFEDVDLFDRKFDTIFTSPPFFNYEHYTDLPGQSANTHTTLKEWMNGFLFPMLVKAWKHLQIGGQMCIYMQDTPECEICEQMVHECESLDGCVFNGIIWIEGHYMSRPIWTFKKQS
jgi:hypothetical protein